MSEVKIKVPAPATKQKVKEALDAKLHLISTALRRPGNQCVIIASQPQKK
jgi:hypothetical protein